MRKYSYLVILLLFALAYSACKKTTSDYPYEPGDLQVGSYIRLDSTVQDGKFNYSSIGAAKASFLVSGYGEEVARVVVYASKTSTLDTSRWRKVKEVPFNGNMATLTVTAPELAAALGFNSPDSLYPGTSYYLYNKVVTVSGKQYSVANTNADFQQFSSNFRMFLTWQVAIVCPFTPTGFAGNFKVVVDEWQDYSPGDIVTVDSALYTPGTNNTKAYIKMTVYPNPAVGGANRRQVRVDIDVASGTATMANQVYGDYLPAPTNVRSQTVSSYNNVVYACTGVIDLLLNHNVSAGSYGNYRLRLQKM